MTRVFLDTAVILYAAGAEHSLREPCRGVLRSVRDGTLDAVISAEVIHEILHRSVAIGRTEIGDRMARDALDLFDPVVPITHAVMDRMPRLVEHYESLAARDLVHVATCIEAGITTIVSPDRGLDAVSEVRRVDPADDAETAALTR